MVAFFKNCLDLNCILLITWTLFNDTINGFGKASVLHSDTIIPNSVKSATIFSNWLANNNQLTSTFS